MFSEQSDDRMDDKSLYERALLEFDAGEADQGLMAKALVKVNGDETKIKVAYIKLRVAQLKGDPISKLIAWFF